MNSNAPEHPIQIRAAEPSDLSAFKELRLQALRDHPEAFSADYQLHERANDEFWNRYFDFNDDATIYLALDEQRLIGMTGVRLEYSPKTRHSAFIWGVYVQPQWRGRRIAEALINACLEWALARGALIAKLGVATTNASAIRCYERCGFTTYGREPMAILHAGAYLDEFLMSRSLHKA